MPTTTSKRFLDPTALGRALSRLAAPPPASAAGGLRVGCCRVLCVVVVGVVAAFPAAAQASGPWNAPQQVSVEGGANPAIAVNRAGQAVLAYSGRHDLMGAVGSEGGTLSAPVALGLVPVGAPVGAPTVAIAPSGEGAVMFDASGGARVAWKRTGGGFDRPQTFPGHQGSGLAFDRRGNAGVALRRTAADGLQHFSIAWRRPGDVAFGEPREVAVTRGNPPRLLFIETGPLLVWSGVPVTGSAIRTHIYASFGAVDGPFSAPVIISNPMLDADRGFGSIAAESNERGDAIVAWTSGVNGGAIDVATRRRGQRFVSTRFEPALARPSVDVSQSGTFLVGFGDPFDPIAVHRDDGAAGGFHKVTLPPQLTPSDPPVMGIDGLEVLQLLVATGASYDHVGTHSVLADGTIGAFDEIANTNLKRVNPNGALGFDARGYGWMLFTDTTSGGNQVYASRYDARKAAAVRAPSISALRYRRTVPRPTRARTSAARRAPAVSFALSKTARVTLSARCARGRRGRRCRLRKSAWKVPGQMGPNGVRLPRTVRRRLKRGIRYRLVVTARDSRGKPSRPKSIGFRW